MNTCEYKLIITENSPAEIETQFNQLGTEGWHLIQLQFDSGKMAKAIACFKRRIIEATSGSHPIPKSSLPLLAKILPLCKKRETNGNLYGSLSFISKKLGREIQELKDEFLDLGIRFSTKTEGKPVFNQIDQFSIWITEGEQGELWFNARPNTPKPA